MWRGWTIVSELFDLLSPWTFFFEALLLVLSFDLDPKVFLILD